MLTATVALVKPRVFMTAGWHNLAMLNFTIEPSVLEPYVPAGTELDFWRGQTYVSIVGFQFLDTRVLGLALPLHRNFVEVNLRFYVVRHTTEGTRRGVVFLREIAPKHLVSWTARWFYNEKYVTMPMRHQVNANGVAYQWWHARKWHGVSATTIGDASFPAVDSEAEFIVEHYWAYTNQRDGSTMEYAVEHPPWRVRPAGNVSFDCDVASIYGPEFTPYLRDPASAFVADGSPVLVRRGRRI